MAAFFYTRSDFRRHVMSGGKGTSERAKHRSNGGRVTMRTDIPHPFAFQQRNRYWIAIQRTNSALVFEHPPWFVAEQWLMREASYGNAARDAAYLYVWWAVVGRALKTAHRPIYRERRVGFQFSSAYNSSIKVLFLLRRRFFEAIHYVSMLIHI